VLILYVYFVIQNASKKDFYIIKPQEDNIKNVGPTISQSDILLCFLMLLIMRLFVVLLGFEPRQTGPESVVLPLHHKTIKLFDDAKVQKM
jgi:hypothetical protein